VRPDDGTGVTLAPLAGLRVVDLTTWIAGAYCTKLLTDGGADVVKIEPPGGDPLRRWSASRAELRPDSDGALFNYLAAGKQSAVADPSDEAAITAIHERLAAADAVVWSCGSAVAEHPSFSPRAVAAAHPHLTVTAITPFGMEGPWADRPATEFTLQAWSGAIVGIGRGSVDRPPTYVGGQVGEWMAGLFAGVGTLASLRRAEQGELIDVSMLEALAMTLTYYPVTFHDQLGYPMRKKRSVPTPGVAAARDGLVGLGCGTGQQWLDFCAMIGHPEWMEDRSLFLNRTGLAPTIDAWIGGKTVDEVLDLASAFRIPNAPIVNGANAATFPHFRERGSFVVNPRDGALNPRPAYRISSATLPPPRPAPRLGQHPIAAESPDRSRWRRRGGLLPFSGLRVLDMTAYWAGPLVGSVLAMLGAEVIHLESAKHPDGARLVGGVPQSEELYWERGPIFAALNSNKSSLTIDLNDPRGTELVHRVVATCDVVVENFTPRVLEQLKLTYDALCAVRPDLVMVRMPGFGLDGPWRELAAFAFVIEDASGLTWLTGHPDALPNEPYCVGDPNAGLHALFGLLLALEHRDRTGEGSLVEAAMVDAALNVAAEQVIEHSAYGALLSRTGNRGPLGAPQNLYHAAGPDDWGRDDSWVAIAVQSDEQWASLGRALGDPEWARDPELASHTGRLGAHERIDTELAEWCRARTADEIVDTLWPAGVPVGKVMQPHRQPDLEQLAHRGFFEELEHPVAPRARYSTLPMRFSRGPQRLHTRAAPLLGQHTSDLLSDLGLSAEQIEQLEADGVIGRTLAPAGTH
jgi:crotonobetainyl-CoA:carnitine CoA-transferase CaiB-like acyl-CoA transferase